MEKELMQGLFSQTDKNDLIRLLGSIDNPQILHIFAANYNWDNGFDIPTVILENEACDFGTGLLMFYRADGYRMLENSDEVLDCIIEGWTYFIRELYSKLINLKFNTQTITFDPELTKVQKYKLKKNNRNIPSQLLDKSPGDVVANMKLSELDSRN